MITDLFDRNIVKVLTLFSISPGSKFSRNDIKLKTMLNNVPLDFALNVLVNNNLLLKEKRLYSLNFEEKSIKSAIDITSKEYLRFKEIPLKVYTLLIDISSGVSSMSNIHGIYLFGSFTKLIHTEKSDVDLAVILKKEDKQTRERIKKEITKNEAKYGKTIEVHFFERKDLKANDPLIKEIKKNSVLLF